MEGSPEERVDDVEKARKMAEASNKSRSSEADLRILSNQEDWTDEEKKGMKLEEERMKIQAEIEEDEAAQKYESGQ